jgi:2-polyprenyl-6-methoxyphenol hydroxylase-like FAD-dependent oxidoreductase
MKNKASCAIVLGGSVAGLLAARVLSEHFTQVIIIERDTLPLEAMERKGVPQGRHLHALLARGYQIMTELFPGFRDDLLAAGALIKDISENVRLYQGRYSIQIRTGIAAVFASRATLETLIRRRVLALANVTLRQNCAVETVHTTADGQQVTGVSVCDRQTEQTETLDAALVVDATGRGSPTLKWLTTLGYATPSESTVDVGVGYATRSYRRMVADEKADAMLVAPTTQTETRSGGCFPVDGQRWVVTLTGRFGDHPPTDEAGFLEFARTLPAPDLYQLIKNAEPLTEIVAYKYPASRRRHYEKLTRFPQRLLVMGDAVCSFNPIYGQGITVCALEAVALAEWLRTPERDGLAFFRRIARVIDTPWALASGADMVSTAKPGLTKRYFARVQRIAQRDPVVKLALIKVTQLLEPPTSLFQPKVLLHVLWGGWGMRQETPPAKLDWQAQTI